MTIDSDYISGFSNWIPVLQVLARVEDDILEILSALADKRVTLEEKMIRVQLHEIACLCLEASAQAHLLMASVQNQSTTDLAELSAVANEIDLEISNLKKIIKYDLNFLEQYFEYDFNARLHYEHRFPQRLRAAIDAIGGASRLKNGLETK